MSAPQAAAITACTACAAVGGAAAGGAFSSGTSLTNDTITDERSDDTPHDHPNSPPNPLKTTPASWFSIAEEETDNKTDFSTDNLIGKVYEKYLVGSYGKTNQSNQAWWEKSYEIYTADKDATAPVKEFSTHFDKSKVNSPFKEKNGQDKDKALNVVCFEAYKKNTSEITVTAGQDNDGSKAKLRADIWKYCSPWREKPKTVTEANDTTSSGTSGSIGASQKDKLLSVKDSDNAELWKYKTELFKKETISDSAYFTHQQTELKKDAATKTLKEVCKETYTKTSNSTESQTNVKQENVLKFCSLEGK